MIRAGHPELSPSEEISFPAKHARLCFDLTILVLMQNFPSSHLKGWMAKSVTLDAAGGVEGQVSATAGCCLAQHRGFLGGLDPSYELSP